MGLGEVFAAVSELLALGGPVVALLLVLSVVSLAVILAKLWQFRTVGVGRRASLEEALDLWDQGKRAEAMSLAKSSKSHIRSTVLEAMDGTGADRAEARSEAELAHLEKGFRLLDSIAQIAPLLGLFGTVLGMIDAFQNLQGSGTTVDPSALAGGIWVALLTTAVGLAVAMPTALVLTWFESRINADRVFADKAIQTVLNPAKRDAA